MEEMEVVLKELKTGKCIDPLGFVREMFINGGEALTQSLLQMANSLKRMKSVPVNWSKMWIQTLKRKLALAESCQVTVVFSSFLF